FERLDEEALMVSSWVKLDDAVDMIFAGKLHNPSAVTGILATWNARARGWKNLRPADSPWMR
ncbi:MAG: ADP-ribose diphosphatase, partial [Actinomycetaceae bacterium UMB1218B]|nr:ADP-ribose diphosphatase [Actinomycetaceae bacterium UMB1218B]